MNKAEFVSAVADAAGLSKTDGGPGKPIAEGGVGYSCLAEVRTVETINGGKPVTPFLKKGDTVALVGFGTFIVRKRAARTGRNPRTGAQIKIKASKNPSFKAGKALKDALN